MERLRYLTAGLALVVAAAHLLDRTEGGIALLVYVQAGYLGSPLPLLFVLGSFALVFGVVLGFQGLAGRLTYLGGIAVVGTFLFGYVVWHTVLDHGAFWPYIEGTHHHGTTFEWFEMHLLGDPYVLGTKAAELVLLVLLIALYRLDPDDDGRI